MQFHHGIQPVEVVGEDEDADGDGVANELLVGEISALHIFQVSLERPVVRGKNQQTEQGRQLFSTIGCASCHIPSQQTERRLLNVSFPGVPADPSANVYFTIDLSKKPPLFRKAGLGVEVDLFADLKRHDMGPGLAESTGDPLDAFFTTARLWGVADTAPYLHDGRAPTLTEAILLHGGEAEEARDEFDALLDAEKEAVLAFLRSLRTPLRPSRGLK
jgi:cytochrome c peroxidase